MNLILNLFAPTFHRISHLEKLNNVLKQELRRSIEQPVKKQIGQLFYTSQLILKQTAELQDPSIVSIFESLNKQYAHISFDYDNFSFTLKRTNAITKTQFEYILQNALVQKIDHPSIRKSLYFHELKDFNKYYHLKEKEGLPKFWQAYEKQKAEMEILDKKNPFGAPIWEKPFKLTLRAQKEGSLCHFIVESTFGKLQIKKLGNQSMYELDAKILDQKTQQIIFEFLEERAGLFEGNYIELKKLSYIGGQVRNIQIMNHIYDLMSCEYT